jgi:hypothetical protein
LQCGIGISTPYPRKRGTAPNSLCWVIQDLCFFAVFDD